jgi:tRNA-binding EMAP/Myf-like protein
MNPAHIKPLISISDLDKIDVRVGTILAVEDVAHSERLVRLRVEVAAISKGVDRRLVCLLLASNIDPTMDRLTD